MNLISEVNFTGGNGDNRGSDDCAPHGAGRNDPGLPSPTPWFSVPSAASGSSVSEFGISQLGDDGCDSICDLPDPIFAPFGAQDKFADGLTAYGLCSPRRT